jgi:DNA polymerase elongation subunit (family B)
MTKRKVDYYGRKKVRDDEILVCGFDVETQGLGGKLLSIQWGAFGKVTFDCSENMIENFFNVFLTMPKPCIWYGHFAQYDWRYLMDYMAKQNFDMEICMRTDTDVYEIRIKTPNGPCIMRDSYAMWNSPLEKLADSFCPEIPKLKIDIENFDVTNPEHIEYAKRDVMILLVGLPRLFNMLSKHFGVTPNATFASTSLKGWQKTLGEKEIYDASKFDAKELFVRQSYYGGLVFLTDTNTQKDCTTYDLNSSYPASMMEYGVPDGRVAESRDYCDGRMGIYHCKVRAPENLIVPILPARDKKGSMRWFRGEFETVVTNRELVFAAKHGYEILEIYSGLVYEKVAFPFNEFISHCRTIRTEYKGGPEEILAKYMQNSLYGKYGSRRERRRIVAAHTLKPQELIGLVPYDESGNWYVQKEIDDEMRCKPEWAVFITAHSRLRLLQAVYTIGPENVIYGDTDSITVKSGFEGDLNVGDEYGQWKLEKRWAEFRAIAPKVYSGVLVDGRRKGAAKGLPRKNLTDEHWRQLLDDGETQAEAMSLPSLRVTLKKGVSPAEVLLRRSSGIENSCNYERLQNGKVRVKIAA